MFFCLQFGLGRRRATSFLFVGGKGNIFFLFLQEKIGKKKYKPTAA